MSNLPNFEGYDDEKLEAARLAVAVEQERRQRLAAAPAEVAQTARRYIEDGGDKAALLTAFENADAPSEPDPQ